MIIVLLILLIGYIVVVSHDTWWGVSNGRGNTTFDEITSDQITNNLISGGSVVVKAPPNYQPYYHRVLDNL
jgi:ABC-type cobalt transport system substrate-binding protein